MSLKLYVQFIDDGPTRFLGEPPLTRVATIELTDEQAKTLVPRKCGSDRGIDFYEMRRVVSLQDEPEREDAK